MTLNAGRPDLSLRAVPNGHPQAEDRVSHEVAKCQAADAVFCT